MKRAIDANPCGDWEERRRRIWDGLRDLGYKGVGGGSNVEHMVNEILHNLDIEETKNENLTKEIEAAKKKNHMDIKVGDLVVVSGYAKEKDKEKLRWHHKITMAFVERPWSNFVTLKDTEGRIWLFHDICVVSFETQKQPKIGEYKDGKYFRSEAGWCYQSRFSGWDRRANNDRLSQAISLLGKDIPRTSEQTFALKTMLSAARGGVESGQFPALVPFRSGQDRRKK